jgi:hypothetical protein
MSCMPIRARLSTHSSKFDICACIWQTIVPIPRTVRMLWAHSPLGHEPGDSQVIESRKRKMDTDIRSDNPYRSSLSFNTMKLIISTVRDLLNLPINVLTLHQYLYLMRPQGCFFPLCAVDSKSWTQSTGVTFSIGAAWLRPQWVRCKLLYDVTDSMQLIDLCCHSLLHDPSVAR